MQTLHILTCHFNIYIVFHVHLHFSIFNPAVLQLPFSTQVKREKAEECAADSLVVVTALQSKIS